MLTLPPSVEIYLATQPVDARKSFDGLAAIVESEFQLTPMSGHLFVFVNRRGHVVQMLFWDRSGFCILKKRLQAGTFKVTRDDTGAPYATIDSAQLALMLEGIDLTAGRRRKRYSHAA